MSTSETSSPLGVAEAVEAYRTPPKISWRILEIDGVRALAMLMVFTYHIWENGDSPKHILPLFGLDIDLFGMFNQFPAGVDMFMVLSGFCLFLPVCKREGAPVGWDWKDYARRRVVRIVPTYYVAIMFSTLLPFVLVVLFHLLHQKANWPQVPSAMQFITHLTFTHTLFAGTWGGICGAFWSLGLEAQFYLVFPLVIWAYSKCGIRVTGAMMIVSVLYRIIGAKVVDGNWTSQFLMGIFFLGRWMEFALGMLAAYIVADYRRKERTLPGWQGTLAIAGALGLYLLATSPRVDPLWAFPAREFLLGTAYALLMTALCTTGTPLRRLFASKPMVTLALFSYSLFLIHQPLAYYLSEMFKKILHVEGEKRFLLLMTIGFLLICGISYVFFLLFEKPFLPKHSEAAAKPKATA